MNAQLEKIRATQREAWNKSSVGWKRWDSMMMSFLSPVSDAMISTMDLQANSLVLDVATGTGEPGLTIAGIVRDGKVTGTDLAESMVDIANENARLRGIFNFEAMCCDVTELPFPDNHFDSVTCRHGFMFFGDMKLALQEMIRVVKPGGAIVTSAWSTADKNSWICTSMQTMIGMLGLTPPPQGGPGLFRCAQPSVMLELFESAGLNKIVEQEVNGHLPCDSEETYWNFISEVASPTAFKNADEETKELIKMEVMKRLKENSIDGGLKLDASSLVICGRK